MCRACGSAWRVAPRVARAQVHLPASAVTPRPFVSVSPLRRGSFALGTGRSPMCTPHVPCMWKRLAGRPTGGAGPSPPTTSTWFFSLGEAQFPFAGMPPAEAAAELPWSYQWEPCDGCGEWCYALYDAVEGQAWCIFCYNDLPAFWQREASDGKRWGRRATKNRVYLLDPERQAGAPVPKRFEARMVECMPNDGRRGTVLSCLVFRCVDRLLDFRTPRRHTVRLLVGTTGICSRITSFSLTSPRPSWQCSEFTACWRCSC
jgi:hypothetical protein